MLNFTLLVLLSFLVSNFQVNIIFKDQRLIYKDFMRKLKGEKRLSLSVLNFLILNIQFLY